MEDSDLCRVSATFAILIYSKKHSSLCVKQSFPDGIFTSESFPHMVGWKTDPHPWINRSLTLRCTSPKEFGVKNAIYLSLDNSTVYITFRGTDTAENVLTDLNFLQTSLLLGRDTPEVLVHKGFHDAYMSLRSDLHIRIIECLDECSHITDIVFTGHSLGGAIASLAALDTALLLTDRKQTHVTVHLHVYGAPAVGNAKYVDMFNEHVKGNNKLFANRADLVPRCLDAAHCVNQKLLASASAVSMSASSAMGWVKEPYCHTSELIILDHWMKLSVDAAKHLLASKKPGPMSVPTFFLQSHKMTAYIDNLEMYLSGKSLSLQSAGNMLLRQVVPAEKGASSKGDIGTGTGAGALNKQLSTLSNSVTALAGISVLAAAVTNYHIYYMNKRINKKLEEMQDSIIRTVEMCSGQVIESVSRDISDMEKRQLKNITLLFEDSLDRASNRLDDLEKSLQLRLDDVLLGQINNPLEVCITKTRLNCDQLLRSYERYVEGEAVDFSAMFIVSYNILDELHANLVQAKLLNAPTVYVQYEFAVLVEECRLCAVELYIRSHTIIGVAIRKRQLVVTSDHAIQPCFCFRVGCWLYCNGMVFREQALALSTMTAAMLSITTSSITSDDAIAAILGQNCSSQLVLQNLEEASLHVIPRFAMYSIQYGTEETMPLALLLLREILLERGHVVEDDEPDDDRDTTISTLNELVPPESNFSSQQLLLSLLLFHFDPEHVRIFCGRVISDLGVELAVQSYHYFFKLLRTVEVGEEVVGAFHLAVLNTEHQVICEMYTEMLTQQIPPLVVDYFISILSESMAEKCYEFARSRNVLTGKIIIRSFEGLYEGFYSVVGESEPRKVLMHGLGRMVYSNGDVYNGSWFNGRRHGQGEFKLSTSRMRIPLFSANGISYKGDWVDGKKHGRGVTTYSTGAKVEGQWREDVLEGRE